MIKLPCQRTFEVAISLAVVSSAVWLNSEANAYPVSFQGGITIDFGIITNPPLGNVGLQTITVDDTVDLPLTQEEILLSLADGDSSIPIEPLLAGFFPQELEVNGQSVILNDIDITTFVGTGIASSDEGFLTNFNFEYINSDPVLEVPVVELTGFNSNLSQCVNIKCQYNVASSNLTALFDATLITSETTTDLFATNTDFTISLTDALVTASLSATAVPESTAWFVLPVVFGGVVLSKFLFNEH
ncbi:MAG: hypothetical protein AB4041_10590 [Microcystaceae cyanobacterium]